MSKEQFITERELEQIKSDKMNENFYEEHLIEEGKINNFKSQKLCPEVTTQN